MLCTFCNKEFKTKYALKAHQERPICLKNKSDFVKIEVYQCELCEKVYTTKQNLDKHNLKCPLRKKIIVETFESISTENITLKHTVKDLASTVDEQARQLDEQARQIEDLKALVYRLTDKTTNVTNNDNRKFNINIHIKNYIKASPECMSVENLEKYIPKMNIGHVLSEGTGYGNFITQYVLQHIRMITTDASRGVVYYKGENGKVYKDIGLTSFFKKFGIASASHVKYLVETFLNSLNLDLSEPNNIEQYRDYTRHITQMNQCSNGDKSDFIPSALKVVSAGTDHSNLIF